jgi:C1A family cysteine protease
MVSCDYNNFGCNGGYLAPSLTYLLSEGLVSENCLPYKNKGSLCAYKCDSSSEQYRKYACQTGSMKILTITEQIQQEIMTNGPMMVGFTVYNDFLSYSNGIYEPTTSDVAGGHAVKIIGWDRDGSNRLFWICQNQWGTGWGMSGYFNIYAGKSGLDSAAFACSPDL